MHTPPKTNKQQQKEQAASASIGTNCLETVEGYCVGLIEASIICKQP